MSYFIDGIITSGSLVSIIDSAYNLLIYDDTYSSENVSDGTISPYFAILQLVIESSDENKIYVYFKNGDTYVYPNNGTFQTSSTKPNLTTLVQTTYQPWEGAAFPGTLYNVYDVNNNPFLNPIYLVPSIWYAKPCKPPAAAYLALKYHIQWMQTRTITTIGFTTKKDCKSGFDYKLCPYGSDCETTCKGPCEDPNLTCKLLHSQFVCARSTSDWFESKILYIIIGIFVLILALALLIGILESIPPKNDRVRKSKTQNRPLPRNSKRTTPSRPNPK